MAINLAIGQVFCANLANNTVVTGVYQGAYGIGGTIAPLIATSMVSRGYLWTRFYTILLGLATFNLFFTAWAFWNYETDSDPGLPPPAGEQSDRNQSTITPRRRWNSIKTVLTDKTTIFGAMFIFGYQVSQPGSHILFVSARSPRLEVLAWSMCGKHGFFALPNKDNIKANSDSSQGAEVAISGWVISFLVQFRHGDPSKVGYVTSGFWAGITLGESKLQLRQCID